MEVPEIKRNPRRHLFQLLIASCLLASSAVIQERMALADTVATENLSPGAAGAAVSRERAVAQLLVALRDQPFTTPPERLQLRRILLGLSKIRAAEAVPDLIDRLSFRIRREEINSPDLLDFLDAYPAALALVAVKEAALPAMTEALASPDVAASTKKNLIYTMNLILANRRLSIFDQYSPEQIQLDRRKIVKGYGQEYIRRAVHLREVAQELSGKNALEDGATVLPRQTAGTPANVPQGGTELRVAWLTENLEARRALNQDTADAEGEKKTLDAIAHVVLSRDTDAIPALVRKLVVEESVKSKKLASSRKDTMPLPVPFPLQPAGLQSPAIAQAAAQAIEKLGAASLPALIETIEDDRRSDELHKSTLALILKIAGAKDAATGLLLQAAERNDEKAARLEAWIKPTP